MNATHAGTRSPLETRLMVAAGYAVGYSMVIAMTVIVGLPMAAQAAWKTLTCQPRGRHAIRHGRPATR